MLESAEPVSGLLIHEAIVLIQRIFNASLACFPNGMYSFVLVLQPIVLHPAEGLTVS